MLGLRHKALKVRLLPTFIVFCGDETTAPTNLVQFFRVKDAPGYTHRVVINQKAVDWLGDNARPNATSARYFAEKHRKELYTTASAFGPPVTLLPLLDVPETTPPST